MSCRKCGNKPRRDRKNRLILSDFFNVRYSYKDGLIDLLFKEKAFQLIYFIIEQDFQKSIKEKVEKKVGKSFTIERYEEFFALI